MNKIINFFKNGFKEAGYSVTLLNEHNDLNPAYKYSLNRDYKFFWFLFRERIDIFIEKEDLERKIEYMNISIKNYNWLSSK